MEPASLADRPLKILHTEAARGMGGQEIYLLRHLLAMRARGHDLSLLCQPGARLAEAARSHGFVVHTLEMGGLPRLLRGIPAVRDLVRTHRYDVVNVTSRRDALIAAAGARLAGAPLVVRSRHLMSPVHSLLTYTWLPHRIITVSQFVKRLLQERGIAPGRIGVVPPMAQSPQATGEEPMQRSWQELQRLRAEVRDEFGFDDDDVVVGCVAVLREPKGHLDLLDAIAPLCRENPKLHLLIIGDGEPVMSRLKASSAQYGIERQIHLPGYRNDAARLMAGFDVFALPSHKEAAGTVFLEAAEAGVPIVATRVGGIPEMLVEQVNALLVELGDQAALTAALRTLATSGELRRKMGRAGREWLHQEHRFTVAGHCEATEHHYHQWLEELGHGPRQVGTGADAPPRQPVAGHDHGLPGKL
ncbi:MAG: glycosyltransferase family 4 protein [Stenotrophomonas nitritireducens]|uniref:glycosyltransferase family 4 protein n=1 Tax=Stenotrophomonas nitritireducens TaxID=83617 RepID=UPI001AC5A000|nr:glycosyltransferase family 4 protein [Stenotrophomonas nitritireducens]MBN8769858.1 glycosyltransferase family 4 protein [Stenotrophomonas sp.]MBN8790674.1 glycosyltransferase family 4 protein [Stenotrophomonas nitritireducens]